MQLISFLDSRDNNPCLPTSSCIET